MCVCVCERNYIHARMNACGSQNRKWPGCAKFLISLMACFLAGNTSCPSIYLCYLWRVGTCGWEEGDPSTLSPIAPASFSMTQWFTRKQQFSIIWITWCHTTTRESFVYLATIKRGSIWGPLATDISIRGVPQHENGWVFLLWGMTSWLAGGRKRKRPKSNELALCLPALSEVLPHANSKSNYMTLLRAVFKQQYLCCPTELSGIQSDIYIRCRYICHVTARRIKMKTKQRRNKSDAHTHTKTNSTLKIALLQSF